VLAGAVAAQTAVSVVNFGLPAVGPELQEDAGIEAGALTVGAPRDSAQNELLLP